MLTLVNEHGYGKWSIYRYLTYHGFSIVTVDGCEILHQLVDWQNPIVIP